MRVFEAVAVMEVAGEQNPVRQRMWFKGPIVKT